MPYSSNHLIHENKEVCEAYYLGKAQQYLDIILQTHQPLSKSKVASLEHLAKDVALDPLIGKIPNNVALQKIDRILMGSDAIKSWRAYELKEKKQTEEYYALSKRYLSLQDKRTKHAKQIYDRMQLLHLILSDH